MGFKLVLEPPGLAITFCLVRVQYVERLWSLEAELD